ncbi:hypothetical protein M9H77_31799 [Catharanthus roseus]|uniref:Uncharacterized protein n=1 Tax=Catharanthus roseus TaxID=4058 RepID=A0ACC0A149_CATRO|nr:hypothetical protein M9H77_31799 [Catharanthus roseus]
MAHLQPYSPSILKGLLHNKELSRRSSSKAANHSLNCSITGKRTRQKPFGRNHRRRRHHVQLLHCCSTSSPNSSSAEQLKTAIAENVDVEGADHDQLSLLLINEHGWQVRRMVETEDEMRTIARVQAEAFHEPAIIFNDLFFEFFQAEVLAGLLYRLRNSPPNRYACLVAKPAADSSSDQEEPSSADQEIRDLVGVVDVTVLRDADVLQYLRPEADEYLYVSGIAVVRKLRRQKVATALLKACDVLAMIWGFEYLVLRAYEDDWGARKLYSNAGYEVVGGDPSWLTTWIGRRRRILMVKRSINTWKNSVVTGL